jgi:hypothetical protein
LACRDVAFELRQAHGSESGVRAIGTGRGLKGALGPFEIFALELLQHDARISNTDIDAEVVAGTYTYGTDLLVDRKESVNALTILIGTHDRTVVIDAKGSHIR